MFKFTPMSVHVQHLDPELATRIKYHTFTVAIGEGEYVDSIEADASQNTIVAIIKRDGKVVGKRLMQETTREE